MDDVSVSDKQASNGAREDKEPGRESKDRGQSAQTRSTVLALSSVA